MSMVQKTSDKANFQMLEDFDCGAETEVPEEKVCFRCVECDLVISADQFDLMKKHKEHTLALLQAPHQVPINDLAKLSLENAGLEKAIVVMYKYMQTIHQTPEKTEKTFDQFADMLEQLQDLCAVCGAICLADEAATIDDIVAFVVDHKNFKSTEGALYYEFAKQYSDQGQFLYDMVMISQHWRETFIQNFIGNEPSEAQYQLLVSLAAF